MQTGEALFLSLLRHMHEELHHNVAVVGQLTLEIGYGIDVRLLGHHAALRQNGGKRFGTPHSIAPHFVAFVAFAVRVLLSLAAFALLRADARRN